MAGEMQVDFQGKDLTIRRFASKSNPFGGFEAVYTATGDPVPGLTAANVGETLTGAGKEVFLRSAFVGQNGTAVTPNGELEARISALATSGQEDVSYSATERRLKDWRNRRRSNRANGLIPELETELADVEQTLRDMERLRRQRDTSQAEREELEKQKTALEADLETWNRLERQELNRRYAQALEQWRAAQAAVPAPAEHPVFGTMTGDEAWAYAQKKQQEREAALADNRFRQQKRDKLEQEAKARRGFVLVWCILAVCTLFLGLVTLISDRSLARIELVAVALLLLCASAIDGLRRRKKAQKALELLSPVPVPTDDDLLTQAADYREALAQREQAAALAQAARRRVEDLEAQGAQTVQTLELLTPPAQNKTATAARLGAVTGELSRLQREISRSEGALAQMGGAEELEIRQSQLEEQLKVRTQEYDALTDAMDALSEANSALRERFSPALNREASQIFSQLTGGKWTDLELSRDFSANTIGDGPLPRSALYLSTGTGDQLYLAVRLAMCRLTLPECPILLDDALAAFDDDRMEKALDYLEELGRERQILLFSCHSREGRWGVEHGVPVRRL
jgi:hypothetical protein